MEDYEIVKQILAGKKNEFTILVNKYRTSLFWVIYKILGNINDAEDITAETFVKAYENLNTFEPNYLFSTWLYTIGKNKAIDFLRVKNRQPNPINNPVHIEDNSIASLISPETSAEDNMIREERDDIIFNTIEELKPFHKTLINLRYYKGLTYEEIAKELNKPIGTIKTGLFRARKTLYKLIKDNKNIK